MTNHVLLVIFAQILSGGSLCGKSCVGDIVKILLCEGGDIELGARTSNHVLLFAIDPLSLNSLLFTVHCIILFISYMLGLFVRLTCI